MKSYQERFASMGLRNRDLYLAFVEQAMSLAGRKGNIAFIMPNFARNQAGRPLRLILEEKSAVKLWVDFDDVQVFPDATNYVALLFAAAGRRKSNVFDVKIIDKELSSLDSA